MAGTTNGTGEAPPAAAPVAHPKKADYDKLVAAHEKTKKALASEKAEHAKTKAVLEQVRTNAEAASSRLTVAEKKVDELRAEREGLHAAVAASVAASPGPTAEDPRAVFVANGVIGDQEDFPNLAALEEAKKARPNYYFDDPDEAWAAYKGSLSEELQ